MKIRAESIYLGTCTGLLAGLMVAVVITALDWHDNPGGIFRGDSGTNWPVVMETAFSWFWPVTLILLPVAVLAHAAYRHCGAR